jgi:thioesterase domain-containing protein
MLVPIQTSGQRAPVFLLHGNSGFMPTGKVFARVLGPEQPVYVINAKGFDGSEPHETVADMVNDYLADVLRVTNTGPVVIAGQCWGNLAALELATELLARGFEMGPLVLVDPPRVPVGQVAVEVNEETKRQLYDYTHGLLTKMAKIPYLETPFDVNDPEQLHHAVLTGMASMAAVSKFTPRPFLGTAELILSVDSAPQFFGRNRPWQRVLPNPPMIHVMPYGHTEMLHNYRFDLARLFRLSLEWNARRGAGAMGQRRFGMQNRFGQGGFGQGDFGQNQSGPMHESYVETPGE